MHSGQYKLINKVDHLIPSLAKGWNLTLNDNVRKTDICDAMKTFKLRCLSLMYNEYRFFFVTCE